MICKFSDGLKYVQWLKSIGVDHYNSTIFREYDIGTHTLRMGHYKSYDKDNKIADEGTYVSFDAETHTDTPTQTKTHSDTQTDTDTH